MLESGANYLSASGQLGTNDQMQSFGTPMPTTVLQRFLPVAALGRTHIDCRQSVAGPDGKRVRGGQLCEVQRSFVPVVAAKADPMTALPGHEQVLTTHNRHPQSRRSCGRSLSAAAVRADFPQRTRRPEQPYSSSHMSYRCSAVSRPPGDQIGRAHV